MTLLGSVQTTTSVVVLIAEKTLEFMLTSLLSSFWKKTAALDDKDDLMLIIELTVFLRAENELNELKNQIF